MRLSAALVLAAALAASPAPAVLIDSGDGTGNTTAPAADPGWKNVGLRGGLNAVYLGYGWVLTAAHVGFGSVTLAGVDYPAVPGSYTAIGDPGSTADLIAFRIDPYPYGIPALEIPTSPPPVGAHVVLIGTGQRRGAFAQWMGMSGWWWAGGSTKRWGTNLVGASVGPGPPVNTTDLDMDGHLTRALVADFSENAPDDESTVTVGDSGGAFFVKDGSSWKLGGITFALGTYVDQPANTSLYGNVVYAADLSHYRAQILAVARPCADGVDNDSNGLVDYPSDPGCTWIGDLSEGPDCSDGIDNDNDGTVDLADFFCSEASDAREEPDVDSDGVTDAEDDCLFVPNSNQRDSNGDGYGNACDADFNDDGVVGVPDVLAVAQRFGATVGSPAYDPNIDTDGDGSIGVSEFLQIGRAHV